MSDVKFQVGDRVRWGTAEGVVVEHFDREYLTFRVNFNGRYAWFGVDGSYIADLPGQPLLELVERPKKTRKVKVWRWECPPFFDRVEGWTIRQTGRYSEKGLFSDWTKVPGSEREIEVTEEE